MKRVLVLCSCGQEADGDDGLCVDCWEKQLEAERIVRIESRRWYHRENSLRHDNVKAIGWNFAGFSWLHNSSCLSADCQRCGRYMEQTANLDFFKELICDYCREEDVQEEAAWNRIEIQQVLLRRLSGNPMLTEAIRLLVQHPEVFHLLRSQLAQSETSKN